MAKMNFEAPFNGYGIDHQLSVVVLPGSANGAKNYHAQYITLKKSLYTFISNMDIVNVFTITRIKLYTPRLV